MIVSTISTFFCISKIIELQMMCSTNYLPKSDVLEDIEVVKVVVAVSDPEAAVEAEAPVSDVDNSASV